MSRLKSQQHHKSNVQPFTVRRLRTVKQFSEEQNAFTEGALRWFIFNANDNGLAQAGAIVRLGRRVYVEPDNFLRWVETKQRGANGAA